MSLDRIFDIAGSGMSAQSVRLNTVASNVANAQTVAGSEEEAYRSKQPVFQAVLKDVEMAINGGENAQTDVEGVRVSEITESDAPVMRRYQPNHPLADDNGFVYASNVNMVEEMANMMSAQRSYETNVEVMSTTKQLLLATLKLGQ